MDIAIPYGEPQLFIRIWIFIGIFQIGIDTDLCAFLKIPWEFVPFKLIAPLAMFDKGKSKIDFDYVKIVYTTTMLN